MILFLWTLVAVGAPVTLEEAWRHAAHAPDAELAAVEEALGRASRLEARALRNPDVVWGGHWRHRGTADAINGEQHQIDVGLPLPITGEHLAALRRGRLAERWGSARAATRRALLAEAVAVAWLELLAAQEAERAIEGAVARLRELLDVARRRADEGATRAWDVRRMELEARSVERMLARTRQERAEAAARLGALLGGGGGAWEAVGALERPLPLEGEPGGASPFVVEARAAVEHARQQVRQVRRSTWAEPELRVGTLWTRDGDSASLFVGWGGELPVLDRGRGRVLRARAELAAAEAELRRAEAEAEADAEALRRALDALRAVASDAAGPDEAFVRGAEIAWQEGETGMLELVDALAVDLATRLEALGTHHAIREGEVRLALLEGRLPPIGP